MPSASEDEAREFADAFRWFLEWVHSGDTRDRNEVVALIQDYLGVDGCAHSVVSRRMPAFDHVNLQTALNAWSTRPGRSVTVQGIAIPPHFGSVGLQQLISGEGIPPLRLSAPPLVDLPNGPGSTLACVLLAALLVSDLLDTTQQATRSLLGVGNDAEDLPPGGGLGSLPAPSIHQRGWVGYPRRGRPPRF